MRTAPAVTLVASLLLAACGGGQSPNGFTYPGLQAHEQYFPLMGTAHEPAQSPPAADYCTGCHATTSFRDKVAPVNCRGCHFGAAMTADPALNPDSIHGTAVAGYLSARDTGRTNFCRDCHPMGQSGMSDGSHHTFFPVGAGTRHNRSCVACHGSANKRDVAALKCASCHQDPALFPGFSTKHNRVLDYPAQNPTSIWCLRCHDGGKVDTIAGHGRLLGAAGRGGPGDGDHDTHCFQCHTMVPPAAPFNGPASGGLPNRPWAQDWKQSACSKCH